MDGLESLRSNVTIVFTDRPVGFVQGPDPGGLAGSVASKTAFKLKYKILPLFLKNFKYDPFRLRHTKNGNDSHTILSGGGGEGDEFFGVPGKRKF